MIVTTPMCDGCAKVDVAYIHGFPIESTRVLFSMRGHACSECLTAEDIERHRHDGGPSTMFRGFAYDASLFNELKAKAIFRRLGMKPPSKPSYDEGGDDGATLRLFSEGALVVMLPRALAMKLLSGENK